MEKKRNQGSYNGFYIMFLWFVVAMSIEISFAPLDSKPYKEVKGEKE